METSENKTDVGSSTFVIKNPVIYSAVVWTGRNLEFLKHYFKKYDFSITNGGRLQVSNCSKLSGPHMPDADWILVEGDVIIKSMETGCIVRCTTNEIFMREYRKVDNKQEQPNTGPPQETTDQEAI